MKQTHWIWYVWPCLAPVRETSRPHFSLPDFHTALAYLMDPVLRERLLEITSIALQHLKRGVRPVRLFGSSTDAAKFHETCTCFALAGAHLHDLETASLCSEAVQAMAGGELEPKTMQYIAGSGGFPQYGGIATVGQLVATKTEPVSAPMGAG